MKIKSKHSAAETLDRLSNILGEKGIAVVARINHSAAAAKVEKDLRPTELMMFGNPVLGTPLMQANQEAGFDLPMKALAWEDQNGQTWLRVTDPAVIQSNHSLSGVDPVLEKMTNALTAMATAAAS